MSELTSLLTDYKKQVSLFAMSLFYAPIAMAYSAFAESTRQAEEIGEKNGYASADYSSALIEAMDIFNAELIKNHINNTIIECTDVCNGNEIDAFIRNHYKSVTLNCDEYAVSEVEIQQLRDRLFSFFKIFEKQLHGMAYCLQKVEQIIRESQNLTDNLRSGLTGGAIGGVLGSILLPGIGTWIGAAAGGYFLGKNKDDKARSRLIDAYNDYVEYSNQFIELLRKNAPNFLAIIEHFITYIYESRLNKLYHQTNAIGLLGEEVVIHFLKNEINLQRLSFDKKIDEKDKDSFTFNDCMSYTQQFIS